MKIKKLLLSLTIIFAFSATINAQTSDMGFSFQGYAIDPNGKAMASTAITVRFSITPGTFTEEHSLTTDAFGVFNAVVGNSSVAKKAEFKKIDFTKKSTIYSLKVEVKKTSGGVYTIISNEPMKAVPYARYAFNGVPVGTIIAYGGDKNNIPEGWLLCDGASLLQTDYPQLYTIIGNSWGTSGSSFNLPDLRGRFLRGVDRNMAGSPSGNDPDVNGRTASNAGGNTGNSVGSVQGDLFRSHVHYINLTTSSGGNHRHSLIGKNASNIGGGNTGGDAAIKNPDGSGSYTTFTEYAGAHTHTVSGNSYNTGGNETRPVNAAVYYIIKY